MRAVLRASHGERPQRAFMIFVGPEVGRIEEIAAEFEHELLQDAAGARQIGGQTPGQEEMNRVDAVRIQSTRLGGGQSRVIGDGDQSGCPAADIDTLAMRPIL